MLSYSTNMHLGILHGMNKLIPFYKSKNKFTQEANLVSTIFWMNLFLAILSFFIFIIISFFTPSIYKIPLIIIGFASLLQQLFAFYFVYYRANSNFKIVSIGIGLLPVISFILLLLFSSYTLHKLEGGLFALVLANLSIILIFQYYQNTIKYDSFVISELKIAFITGSPLIIIGILDTFLITVDRWLIASSFSTIYLGIYSIGVMTSSLISIIPSVISSVIYPKLIYNFSLNNDIIEYKKNIINPLKISWILILIITIISLSVIPFLITNYLPKYIDSVDIVEYFIIGSYFYSTSFIIGSIIVAMNKQKSIIKLQIFVLFFILTINTIFIKNGFSIRTIAIGTNLGFLIYGIGYNYIAFYYLKLNLISTSKLLLQIILPFLLYIIFYFILIKSLNIYFILKFIICIIIILIIISALLYFDKELKKFLKLELSNFKNKLE